MGRIFKSMLPYWKTILLTLVLLLVQASCDLALPAYTSDIIDVGIQSSGVSHILPDAITAEEFENAKLWMTQEEIEFWEQSYEQGEDEIFYLTITGETAKDEADEKLLMPLLMNYQISQMLNAEDSEDGSSVSFSGISDTELAALKLMILGMENGAHLDDSIILEMRENMSAMAETVGETMLHSMGVAYAVSMDEAAGIDMNKMQRDYLLLAGAKMIGMTFIMVLAAICVSLLASRMGAGIGRTLRGDVFKKVVGFSSAEMDQFSTASLITRCTNDVQQVQMTSVLLIRMVAYAPILGIGGVIRVYRTGAGMGWVIGLAVLLILAFVAVLMGLALPKFKVMQKLVDRVNLVSREILTGLMVIRAFGREKQEEERFDKANRDLTKTMLFTNHVMNFMMPGMSLIMYGLSVMIIWVASHRIDLGVMQVGDMTAFLTYSMQIVMAFLMLTMLSVMLPRAGVAADRIDEVLKTETSIREVKEPKQLTKESGTVTFSHVNFRYPNAEEDALSDIDFTARPGETTAIIGSTGCGKSTLVNLIPRLYDVTEGSITFDGKDIRELSLKDLREKIGYVPQKAVLFSGTIADNLRFGKRDATAEEMEEAAQIAQAADFIEEKKEKYESPIAQGGSNVSGGQKQRLSIARAIAKNPKVYIFDDSFSALDLKTDAKLRKALEAKTKEAAVIIVAQRISTILRADQILVLDEGKIVGKGTHAQLMESCDVYAQIAKSQLSPEELVRYQNIGKEGMANG